MNQLGGLYSEYDGGRGAGLGAGLDDSRLLDAAETLVTLQVLVALLMILL